MYLPSSVVDAIKKQAEKNQKSAQALLDKLGESYKTNTDDGRRVIKNEETTLPFGVNSDNETKEKDWWNHQEEQKENDWWNHQEEEQKSSVYLNRYLLL